MRKFILISLCAIAIFSACEKIVFEDPNNPIDVTAPTVTLSDPANDATGIALNHPITITFSEAMDQATITSSTFTLTQGSTLASGTVTYSGTNAIFTPAVDLLPNSVYTAAITRGAKDLAGNTLRSKYTVSFTTGAAAETVLPVVNSTDPSSNATGIVFNKPVDVTFSEAMDATTINATTFTLKLGTTAVPGAITYTGTKATFTPTGNLAPNSVYTGTITTGVKNTVGFALISDYTFSFTTAAAPDVTAPIINATDPPNNAPGIALNKTIGVTFSESMDPATINTSTFTLSQGTTVVAGAVTYSGTQAIFTPTLSLVSGKIYTGTITTGVKDLAGNALSTTKTFNFSTVAEIVMPVVILTDPLTNATGVVFNKSIDVTFNQAMDPLTITASTFTLKQGTTTVAGAITYTGSKATFSPSISLIPNTVYTGTITSGAKNVAGFALISDYTFSFTTAAAPDITAPTVTATDPLNNATGIALSKTVVVTFSESMNPATISTSTFTLKQGSTAVSGTVTYSGTQATFVSALNLDPSKTYTGTITTGAKDVAGNALSSNYVFNFTTGSAPDVTPPTITLADPINYATAVALTKVVSVTFSEAMNTSTINATTFTLKQGTTAVPGAVTYAGTKASFTPTSNLDPSSIYTGTITTGVKDLAGNAMSSVYTFTFTTGVAPDVTAPTVTLVDPLNNATGVAYTKVIAVTFSEAMNSSSITTSTFTVKQGSTTIAGAVTYSGTTASFTPSSNLAAGTTYTGTITTGVMDLVGNALISSYTFSFTTTPAADVTPPTVSSTDPASNATSIVVSKVIGVTFSEAMNSSTITTSTLTLKQGTTTIASTVAYSGTTATITPSAALTAGTVYTVAITTGAKDLAGNAIAAYTWSFTTAGTAPVVLSFANDVMPVLATCQSCHNHGWTASTNATTYYNNLVSKSYVVPASYTTSNIYNKIITNPHKSSYIPTANYNKIINWMIQGSLNN